MTHLLTDKALLESLNIGQRELSIEIGLEATAVGLLVNSPKRIPRGSTVVRMAKGINAILARRGSARQVTYDELWNSILAGRGVVAAATPDVTADLARIDNRTAAPSAQEV